MSAPDDRDEPKPPAASPVAWKTIARVADEANAEAKLMADLEAMGDADIDAELAADGIGPEDVEALAQVARDAPGAAPAVPSAAASSASERIVISGSVEHARRPPRPSRRGFAIVMAAAACATLLVWQRAAIVAYFAPPLEPIGPDTAGPVPTPPSLAEEAAKVRTKAFAACDAERWVQCQDELDRASGLDPAGDTEPKVKQARAAIAVGLDAGPTAPEGPPEPLSPKPRLR